MNRPLHPDELAANVDSAVTAEIQAGAVSDTPPVEPLTGRAKGYANLVAGRIPRGPGRPPGKGATTLHVQHARVARAAAKLTAERITELGIKSVAGEILMPRNMLRPDAPSRTVTEAKEAALHLINQMLWTLEGMAELGFNADDEARVLKLLAGLNAALPKPNEEPVKPIEEMSEDELRDYAKAKSKR